jgi:hypothetical protein
MEMEMEMPRASASATQLQVRLRLAPAPPTPCRQATINKKSELLLFCCWLFVVWLWRWPVLLLLLLLALRAVRKTRERGKKRLFFFPLCCLERFLTAILVIGTASYRDRALLQCSLRLLQRCFLLKSHKLAILLSRAQIVQPFRRRLVCTFTFAY